MTTHRHDALLVLADGFTLRGKHFAATGTASGPLHVTTALTGYQELLTAPDRAGQLLAFTTPHIGATGTNDTDAPRTPQVAGIVLREATRRTSSWRATGELEADLAAAGVVGICEVDTRELTRRLRSTGPQAAAIISGDPLPTDPAAELARLTTTTPRRDA